MKFKITTVFFFLFFSLLRYFHILYTAFGVHLDASQVFSSFTNIAGWSSGLFRCMFAKWREICTVFSFHTTPVGPIWMQCLFSISSFPPPLTVFTIVVPIKKEGKWFFFPCWTSRYGCNTLFWFTYMGVTLCFDLLIG